MMQIHPEERQSSVKQKLASYSASNLQKLDKLISFFTDYLQLRGVHLGGQKLITTIVLSIEKLKPEGFEVFEVRRLVSVLNDFAGSNLFTFPIEDSRAILNVQVSGYSYMQSPEDRERPLRQFYESLAPSLGFGSVEDMQKNLIIEYHSPDVYKILTNIQKDIKNIILPNEGEGGSDSGETSGIEKPLKREIVTCKCGALKLNTQTGQVEFNKNKKASFKLNPNKYEFKILLNLLEAKKVLSYDSLAQLLYSRNATKQDKDNIAAMIGRLRGKMKIKDKSGFNKDIFIPSNGYKIDC